jgi:hypothetical protein
MEPSPTTKPELDREEQELWKAGRALLALLELADFAMAFILPTGGICNRTWETAATKPATPREWIFDRFRAGQKMAEGARVLAATYEEALEKATRLFPLGDTFALQEDSQTLSGRPSEE